MSTVYFVDGAPTACMLELCDLFNLYCAAMTGHAEVRIQCVCGRRTIMFDIKTINAQKTFGQLRASL